MEEKVIFLKDDEYEKLVKVLNSEQRSIYFKCVGKEKLITIPNKPKATNEKNIVEKWMDDIKDIAETGYQETRESNSERHFSEIESYCNAVIVSVTS